MTEKKMTFEDYLYDKHGRQYTGTDDNMPDDYADWCERLDVDTVVEWATEFGEKKFLDGMIHGQRQTAQAIEVVQNAIYGRKDGTTK